MQKYTFLLFLTRPLSAFHFAFVFVSHFLGWLVERLYKGKEGRDRGFGIA